MNKCSKIVCLLALGCGFLLNEKANAIEGIGIEAGLELPVNIGVRMRMDIDQKFYVSGGLGYAPGFLMDLMGDTAGGLGVVGADTGDLMADSLRDSLYIEARGGYVLDNGVFLEAGLSSFQGGGGDTDECTIVDAINDPFATGPCGGGSFFTAGNSYTIDANTINLTFHGGLEIELKGFRLRVEGGLIKPITADSNVDTLISTAQDRVAADESEEYLNDSFTQDLWIFTIGASAILNF